MLSRNGLTFKSRFTLIELLFVVAIFGILVSILIPSLAKARRKGVQALCLSNTTQQYKTYYLYAVGNKGNLPLQDDRYAPSLFKYRTNFVTLLKEYTSNFGVFNCPSYGSYTTIDDSSNTRSMTYIAYSYYPGRRNPTFGEGPSADNFKDENADASHIFLQDNARDHRASHGLGIWTNHSPVAVTDLAGNPSGKVRRADSLSQMYGTNILFYDGHAKWYYSKSLVDVGTDHHSVRVLSVYPQ